MILSAAPQRILIIILIIISRSDSDDQKEALPLHPAPPRVIIGVYHKGKEKDEKMLDAIKRLFRRKHTTHLPTGEGQGERLPLRIEGVEPAPLTDEPDDAELAAQALLESMCDVRSKMEDVREVAADAHQPIPADAPTRSLSSISHQPSKSHQPSVRDAAYYRRLAERIRLARDQATLRTMRFVTWCEHELEKRDLPIEGKGSLAQMEAELYKRIDTIERVDGELKRRWQHCLANVIVRRMKEERESPADPNTTTD